MGLSEFINELEIITRGNNIDDYKIIIRESELDSEFIDIKVIDKKIIIEGL